MFRNAFLLVVVLGSFGSPIPATAQEDCGQCDWDDATNSHTMWYSELDNTFDCTSLPGAECDGCHWWYEAGGCVNGLNQTASHYFCGGGGQEEELDPASVIAVTQAGDLEDIMELILHEEKVEFNSERSAIQVLDCRGSVAAHIPVSAELGWALSVVAGY